MVWSRASSKTTPETDQFGSRVTQSISQIDDDRDASNKRHNLLYELCGFQLSDFTTRAAFVKLMCRPADPSSLGVTRILFGFLMICDVFQERQFANVEQKWGNSDECRFPLFSFLHPLPLQWMYIVYLAILTGACGLMLGLFYRPCCLLFALGHWYLFLLDKTSWNNHSYLYALCALMFLIFDADRYYSLDGWMRPSINNAHVPLWNYCLIRAQFFLVYFIAGLKKLDADWVGGHSMKHLSSHWVFSPATFLLTPDQVDLWVVHRCGLFIDLFVGYFLFFDKTRPFGFVLAGMFHSMNSQMFSICMFPYTMLATMPLFCHTDWPKQLLQRWLPHRLVPLAPPMNAPQFSTHCLYPKAVIKSEEKQVKDEPRRSSKVIPNDKPTFYHKCTSTYCVLYLLLQCFLPYSHFLTPGYNNWTSGLYGYSWDMMVHNWHTQHIRVTYVDKTTGETGFLNPNAWTRPNSRWSAQADMVKQYATCVSSKLKTTENMTDVALYIDVWRSMNGRFQQRLFDPRVDLVTSPWQPFQPTSWVLPLLVNFSDWRQQKDAIIGDIFTVDDEEERIFVADFPGLELENFVHEDFDNTSIEVLSGKVQVNLVDQSKKFTLNKGDTLQLPAGQFHVVKTISSAPSSYFYMYVNTTEKKLVEKLAEYESRLANKSVQIDAVDDDEEDIAWTYREIEKEKQRQQLLANESFWQRFAKMMSYKYRDVVKSLLHASMAVQSLATGQSFDAMLTANKDPQHATA